MNTEAPASLIALQAEYKDLINHQLPKRARAHNQSHQDRSKRYPVHLNHCFGRIILDTLFNDCWYRHLNKNTPAFRQLNQAQLQQAIQIAKRLLESPEQTRELNTQSLQHRGKIS